jgi:transcriptional regulator with XRE-family HTH domain
MAKSKYKVAKDRVKLTSGDVIRTAREMLEMTQAELAKRSGIRQSHLSEMERGKRPIGKSTAMRLALILEIPPAQILFAGTELREGAESGFEALVAQVKKRERKRESAFLSKILKKLKSAQRRGGAKNRDAMQEIIKAIQDEQEKTLEKPSN